MYLSIVCRTLFRHHSHSFFFFFNDTATTEIYTLSLHDALPISRNSIPTESRSRLASSRAPLRFTPAATTANSAGPMRSEEHTSEIQSRLHLVCRLLLEKKKKTAKRDWPPIASEPGKPRTAAPVH